MITNTNVPLLIKNVSKAFGKKTILNDVSMTVEAGTIVGLIGLNGAGKTTLIKIIIDLLQYGSGSIQFFGIDHTKPESRESLCFLPEKFMPSPFLKGYECIELSLAYHGIRCPQEQLYETSERLGMTSDILNHMVGKYSKGMGQKIGLLSTLLSQRKLLILDEPMSGLDPLARIQLKDLLLEYKAGGNTIFFTSHILSDIEEICDQMTVIHQGEVKYAGSADQFIAMQTQHNLERSFIEFIHQ